jgi:hypothetical protein
MPYITVDVDLGEFKTADLAKELANRERFGSRVVDIDDLIEMLAQWGCPKELIEPRGFHHYDWMVGVVPEADWIAWGCEHSHPVNTLMGGDMAFRIYWLGYVGAFFTLLPEYGIIRGLVVAVVWPLFAGKAGGEYLIGM